MWPAPSAALVTPTAVHCAAPLGYDEARIARLDCVAVVVTCPPPLSSVVPTGQLTVAVVRLLFARPAADVVASLTIWNS